MLLEPWIACCNFALPSDSPLAGKAHLNPLWITVPFEGFTSVRVCHIADFTVPVMWQIQHMRRPRLAMWTQVYGSPIAVQPPMVRLVIMWHVLYEMQCLVYMGSPCIWISGSWCEDSSGVLYMWVRSHSAIVSGAILNREYWCSISSLGVWIWKKNSLMIDLQYYCQKAQNVTRITFCGWFCCYALPIILSMAIA